MSARGVRVGVLGVVLVAVALWALRDWRARGFRTDWKRTVRVELVLAAEAPVDPRVVHAWEAAAEHLEQWLAAEHQRLGGALDRPVALRVGDPVTVAHLPTPPQAEGLVERVKAGLAFEGELARVVTAAGAPPADVALVVALEPRGPSQDTWVEGTAEASGRLGYVRGGRDEVELHLEALIVAHELFHCLGAADAYDEQGHALDPAGLAEPARTPRYPQPFAEVMAGEVPLAPGQGRLPRSLEEVRVGPATGRAIRWLR